MNNSERIERIHEIDLEMARLRTEKECLMSEDVRNSHGIVVVGDHSRGNAHLLLGVLERIAHESMPGGAPFLVHVTDRTLLGSFASFVLREKSMPVDMLRGIKLKIKKELANQKEIRRRHRFSARRSSVSGIRKKARFYF